MWLGIDLIFQERVRYTVLETQGGPASAELEIPVSKSSRGGGGGGAAARYGI